MPAYKYRSAIENLKPYKPGRDYGKLGEQFGSPLNRLMFNENPYGCSPKVREAVIKSLDFPSLYPDEHCDELRSEIAKKHSIEKDEIIFGDGTDELIYVLGKAFINEGDNAVTGKVTFFTYDGAVLSMGGNMIKAPMKNHAYDLDALLNAITPETRLIFIANPNNPTGTVFLEDYEREFLKKVPKNVVVVIDEAYAEFYPGDGFPDTFKMIKEFDNLIVLKTFSKIYGLASFRIGYAVSNRETIAMLNRVKNLFNVSFQAQAAALAAIRDTDFVKHVHKNNRRAIEHFYKRLDEMGLFYIPTNTSFVMVDVKTSAKEISDKLTEKGYLTRSGEIFTMDTFIRVSIGLLEQMDGLADALADVLGL